MKPYLVHKETLPLPKAIQIMNLIQVSELRWTISCTLDTMLIAGMVGTSGTANPSPVLFCSWAWIITRPENIKFICYLPAEFQILLMCLPADV